MNKFIITMILITVIGCLSGCAAARLGESLNACPNPGINTDMPGFSAKYKSSAVNAFYDCEISALAAGNGEQLSRMRLLGIPRPDDLQYQHTLWKQVFSKQKTPEVAQESWLLWKHQEDAANASRVAASAASAAANNAVMQQNMGMTCMAMGPGMVHCQ